MMWKRVIMVESGALAIRYGIEQCLLYLSGLPQFEVITDHQPPKQISTVIFFEIHDKLMKIKQKLQSKYGFMVDDRKGVNHGVPDALRRSPINDPEKMGVMKQSLV